MKAKYIFFIFFKYFHQKYLPRFRQVFSPKSPNLQISSFFSLLFFFKNSYNYNYFIFLFFFSKCKKKWRNGENNAIPLLIFGEKVETISKKVEKMEKSTLFLVIFTPFLIILMKF